MSKRQHHTTGWKIRREHSVRKNHCAAVALAHALAEEPVAENAVDTFPRAARLLEETGHFDEKGTWWGGPNPIMDILKEEGVQVVGLKSESLDHEKTGAVVVRSWMHGHTTHYRHRQGYPTTAQWVRRNPTVQRAIIRGTRHLGYMERDEDGTAHVYNMGARKRIDYAIVLEQREPEPEDKYQPDQPDGRFETAPNRGTAADFIRDQMLEHGPPDQWIPTTVSQVQKAAEENWPQHKVINTKGVQRYAQRLLYSARKKYEEGKAGSKARQWYGSFLSRWEGGGV